MTHKLSLGEEIFNSISHGAGVIFSIVGLVLLLIFSSKGDIWKITGFSIFGGTLIFMYLMSTLYHSLSFTRARKLFKIFDQCAIFLLIAGTYTPIALALKGTLGWVVLISVWFLAVFGVTMKAVFSERFKILIVASYLLMGWLCLLIIKPLISIVPAPAVLLVFAGGVLYSGGLIFYWNKMRYSHAVWHIFVIVGSACHFWAMFYL